MLHISLHSVCHLAKLTGKTMYQMNGLDSVNCAEDFEEPDVAKFEKKTPGIQSEIVVERTKIRLFVLIFLIQ